MKKLTIIFLEVILFIAHSADGFIYLTDNGTHNIDYDVDGGITVDYFTTLNFLDGAECLEIDVSNNAIVNIYGGEIRSGVWARQSSQINIYGGVPGSDVYANPDYVDDDIMAFGTSVITLYGKNFMVDGVSFTSPLYSITGIGYNDPSEPRRNLTGVLSDGSILNANVAVFRVARIEFVNIPEPCTFTLLALGSVALLRKRRRA